MTDAADVIFQGGADELRLEPGGKVYRPGDVMPKGFGGDQRLSLQGIGVRFRTVHEEPAAPIKAPEPPAEKPAEASDEDAPAEKPRRAAKE